MNPAVGRRWGLRISMKGISMTSQPSSRSAEESAPACCFARETRTRQPARGLASQCVIVWCGFCLIAKRRSFDFWSGRNRDWTCRSG